MSAQPRRFRVYWHDELVLEIVDRPGPLISKPAPPPRPGEEPTMHPFLSAVAHVSGQERVLRETLDRSGSLAEFLTALRGLGYRIVRSTP